MFKKRNAPHRRGAAAPRIYHEAAALVVSFAAAVAVPAGPALGQGTQVLGSQVRVMTNQQTGTSYTIAASDCGRLLLLSNASGVTVTVPPAGAAGVGSGCWIDIQNEGNTTVTLNSPSSPIDGGSVVLLLAQQGLHLVSAGTAYFTERGQGSGGSLQVQSGGTSLGPAAALNVVGGTGVNCVPQVNGGTATLQCSADTSYIESKVNLQSGTNPQICTSSSGSGTAYTAACASPLTAYAGRQTLFWFADTGNTTPTPTLNVDTLGAKPLVRQDGTALAAGDIGGGVLYRIWYDGTHIRVVEAGLGSGSTGGGGGVSGVAAATLQGPTNPQICTSSSGSGAAYTAACASSLISYAARQTLFWFADTANTTTTPTLNLDGLGAKSLVRQDGTALAAGDIHAGALYRIWYDGTSIRVVEAGLTYASALTGGGGGGGTSASPAGAALGPTGPVAMNGTDVTLYSLGNVPPLSAGACYEFKGLMQAQQNYVVSIKVDATTIALPVNSNNTWGGYYVGFDEMYCNKTGLQNAQQLAPSISLYSTQYQYGIGFAPFMAEDLGSNYPLSPPAIDWSTSHTITVTMNAASGSGQAMFFKYN